MLGSATDSCHRTLLVHAQVTGPVFESLEELATEAALVVVGRVSLPR